MENFNRAVFTALVAENVDSQATREAIFDLLEFAQKKALKVVSGAAGIARFLSSFSIHNPERVSQLWCLHV